MATAILRPQDCYKLRFHSEALNSSTVNPRRNPNSNSNRSSRRKRSPVGSKDTGRDGGVRDGDRSMVVKFPTKDLAMEQVTILKRGEDLKDRRLRTATNARTVRFENKEDMVLCSTDRLGPEPEMIQKQIRVEEFKAVDSLYAGSAFFSSPPPSSLPFPAFFTKKESNEEITSNLQRMLRLDLL